jgi:hypothetical protein
LAQSSVNQHWIVGSLQWNLIRTWTLVREIEWGAFWYVAQRKRDLMIVALFEAFVMLTEPSQVAAPCNSFYVFHSTDWSDSGVCRDLQRSGSLLGEDTRPLIGDESRFIIEGQSDCRATDPKTLKTAGAELMPRLEWSGKEAVLIGFRV